MEYEKPIMDSMKIQKYAAINLALSEDYENLEASANKLKELIGSSLDLNNLDKLVEEFNLFQSFVNTYHEKKQF